MPCLRMGGGGERECGSVCVCEGGGWFSVEGRGACMVHRLFVCVSLSLVSGEVGVAVSLPPCVNALLPKCSPATPACTLRGRFNFTRP